ncbi:MAG: hypothetical protein AAF627_21770 [Myxococcota bacterium]
MRFASSPELGQIARVVRRGEYLERAVVIPSDEGALEGLFHRGRGKTGLLILPPAPDEGGSMEGPIIAELAWALTRAGHPTLRFNYGGVGASPASDRHRRADAELALAHLQACAPDADIGLCGVGLGAELAAELGGERACDALFLIVPRIEALPARIEATACVVVAMPQLVDASWRTEAQAWGEGAARDFRLVSIPRADLGFRRGLVELGRAAAETFSPPGMIG